MVKKTKVDKNTLLLEHDAPREMITRQQLDDQRKQLTTALDENAERLAILDAE